MLTFFRIFDFNTIESHFFYSFVIGYIIVLCKFVVNECLEPPSFINIPDSLELLRGGSAIFNALARGRPAPKVTWYKDGKPIRRLARLLSVQDDVDPILLQVASEIRLADVAPELNDGVYTVEAVNSVGKVSHDVSLLGKD